MEVVTSDPEVIQPSNRLLTEGLAITRAHRGRGGLPNRLQLYHLASLPRCGVEFKAPPQTQYLLVGGRVREAWVGV